MRLRRTAGVVGLAAVLMLGTAPSAFADYEYPADEPSTSKVLSAPAKLVGDSITVTLTLDETFPPDGTAYLGITGEGAEEYYVEIAGRVEERTNASNGVAVFRVTIDRPGVFTVQGYARTLQHDRIHVGAPQTLTVKAAADDAAPAPTPPGVGELPVTGGEALLYGIGATLLVSVGAAAVVSTRRRRATA